MGGQGKHLSGEGALAWIAALLALTYFALFIADLWPNWFNPDWATDDSRQQVYPWFKAIYPGIFERDLITTAMESYLAPLHYWLGYGITRLTRDPIMTGHWLMLGQLTVTLTFIFLIVRQTASAGPAALAVLWFLHSRLVVQRLTQGLPRGWGAPLITLTVYFVVTSRHRAVLGLLVLGCLLNPPATFLCALTYALYLLSGLAERQRRGEFLRPAKEFLLVTPICIIATLCVLRVPPELGHMATYAEAAERPEFLRPDGRFPFVPLLPYWEELRMYGFQAVVSRLSKSSEVAREVIPWVFLVLLGALGATQTISRVEVVPRVVWCLGLGSVVSWLLARALAFRLYLPDRHLQIPLALFTILACSVGMWKFATGGKASAAGGAVTKAVFAYTFLAALVASGSGSGLEGSANFNLARGSVGGVAKWLALHTPLDSVVGGHPRFVDGIPLFAPRQIYVGYETTHPFYDRYYQEMERRSRIALRAHFAKNFEELAAALGEEPIDYFVFERVRFRPEWISKQTLFEPLNPLIRDLTRAPAGEYAFNKLPKELDPGQYPFFVYQDHLTRVIDVAKLKAYLRANPTVPPLN